VGLLTAVLSEVINTLQHIHDWMEGDSRERQVRAEQAREIVEEHRHGEHDHPDGLVHLDCPLCQLRK
jgi:hypothetical protein